MTANFTEQTPEEIYLSPSVLTSPDGVTEISHIFEEKINVPPLLIGLSGKKRSGKDTAAAILIENHGYKRLAIADEIRRMSVDINPIIRSIDGQEVARLAQVLAEHGGFEHVKDHPQWDVPVREFLQNLGACVALRDPRFWPGPVIEQGRELVAEGTGIVITDVRFPWEVEMVRAAGGIVGRIHRSDLPDDAYTDKHLSETALDNLNEWQPEFIIDSSPIGTLPVRLAATLEPFGQQNDADDFGI